MEKLLELLNEYERERVNHSMKDFIPYGEKSLNDLAVAELISKKFGFINWLVENGKIGFKKFDGDNYNYLENPIGSNNYDECDYLELIQWLAISDTPIKDLIYYLK